MQWIPREVNIEADSISKLIDLDDWEITIDFFNILNKKWGPFTIDRFARPARPESTKVPRFNSKYYVPGTEGVNALSKDWTCENNLLLPPTKLIPRVLKHLKEKPTVGTLVIPHWKSASFWPMICSDYYRWMIKDSFIVTNGSSILTTNENDLIILSRNTYRGAMLVCRIDSTNNFPRQE